MSALDFPASPTDGEVYGNYIWDDTVGVWKLLPSAAPTAVESGFTKTFLLMGA